MKIPKDFPEIPGSKILGNPVPKNPRIPEFGKIPSRKIPELKFLIPLGPVDNTVSSPLEVAMIYNEDEVARLLEAAQSGGWQLSLKSIG